MNKEEIEKYNLFKNKYLQKPISAVTEESLELLEGHCKRQLHREIGQIVREHEIVLELIYRYKKQQKELEQKESILDKVTDKLKEDIKEFNRLRKLHEMYSPSEERLSSKYFYALKLLNIIEGEKKQCL